MTAITGARARALALLLLLLVVLTRYRQAGTAALLPDATLAAMLLGGFYLRRLAGLGLLLAAAMLADQAAVRIGGVSDWCMTPAYAFLVPAYGAAWLAGAWAGQGFTPDGRGALRIAIGFACGSFGWFAISNAGFYLASGYFGDMAAAEYAARVARYFPGYAASAGAYVAAAAALHAALAFVARAARSA